MTITSEQLKAARQLLGWSRTRFASRVGVSERAVLAFESGEPWSRQLDLELVHDTLKSAGVEFIPGSIVLRRIGRARG
jgi:transcriptional regulator with XRE-family HTH domain